MASDVSGKHVGPLWKPPKREKKPPKPLQAKKVLNAKGKTFKAWGAFRRKYLKLHPPDHAGMYDCAIMSARCLGRVSKEEITLDHIIPRSRRPDLRFDPENIQLSCLPCNSEKGSKTI